MAPLTRTDKYHDLIRLSAEPSTLLNKLSDADSNDVEHQRCPLILRSITSSRGDIRVDLARNLRIDFQLYSKLSREYRRNFPERVSKANSVDPFSLNDDEDLAELFVFCHSTKKSPISLDRQLASVENLLRSIESSDDRFRILQHAIKVNRTEKIRSISSSSLRNVAVAER